MNKIILFFTLLIVTCTNACAQCMMFPVSLNQRVSGSSLVIEGKVINQASFWDPSHSNIYTSNLIEVYKAFKSNSSAYVEVITEGGTVGNDKEVVEPSLELSIGDVGVFTLNANALTSQFNKLVYQAYASAQGFIKYNVAENQANEPFKKYLNISTALYSEIQQSTLTNYTVVKPVNPFVTVNANSAQAVAAITGFSPTTITAGTFSVLTINGSGFGATRGTSFVEFKRADDGGTTFCQPDAWSYVSWSDSQILVKLTTTGASTINSTPGSGVIRVDVGGVKTTSTASLTVQYAHLNVYSSATAPITIYNTRHVDKQAGGYAWQMFTGFDSNTLAKASFLRAFQSWRCGTFINWTTAATTTVNVIAKDSINIIRFDIGTELPTGVLGRCSSRFSGCGAQPNQNWYVTELDIVFDDGASWNFGPAAPAFAQYDFESVAAHELGHGHQLGHIINPTEIMNYSLTNGQQKRTLSVNDLAGGNAIMARNLSGGVCANSTMIGLTASNCALGAPTASFTANKTTICAGQTVVFTNLSAGSPTLTTWTFAGVTPSTSTVSSPTVTYNTPGTYSVQLVATNSIGSNTYSVIAYINVTSAASLPVVQDFQSATYPPTNWYINDAGNDNIKWKLKTTAGYNSTQSTVFDNWTDSITPNRDELKTYVNLSGFAVAKMTFYRSYSQTYPTPLIDTLQIGVSINCGTSTTYPYLKGGSQLATATTSSSAAPFTPTAVAQWKKDSIDLTPFVGQANVMIAFINRGHYGDAIYLDNINITGVAAASPTAAINSNSIGCTGTPIIFTDASTGSPTSWLWDTAGGTPTTAITQSVSVTYTTAGVKTITLTVANASGTNTATKTITITATPTVVTSITNTTICSGTIVVVSLTGGASSYSWSPTGSGTISTLNPTVTTVYTVTGSNGSCVSTPTTFTINVNTTPTVNIAASSTTICAGQTSTLTASGATNYAWLPGGQTTTPIVVTPTVTTTYTVNGSNGTCSTSKTITINVSNTPTVVTSITNTTICSGIAVVVSVTGGASSYSWSPTGSGTTSTLNPTVTTIYTVTGSNGSCVSAPKTFTINVNTTPTVNIAASSTTICAGQTAILTASGATNYAWLPGSQTTTPIVVTPTVTTTYTVNGSNGTCSTSKTITINVSNTPTVVTSITNTTICSGTAVVVSVTGGASSYSWSPTGSGTTSTLNPTVTTIYTVTGSNGSCVSAPKTFTINVNTTPTVNIAASSTTICAGQTAILTASGATNYAWLPGSQTTAAIVVTPTVTTTYTVNGANGTCYGTKTITINIANTPTVVTSITNTTICSGIAVVVSVTGGASSYSWSPTGSGTISTLNPTVTTVYTVTGSNGSCVSAPTTFTINVNTTPTVNVVSTTNAICVGQTATLTASGATNYSWLPGGQTTTAIVVTPTVTTTYTVNGANGTCYGTKTITINVSNTPTVVTSITNTTICSGTAVVVSVTGGASSYSWSPTGSGTISTLNPTVTTVYTVTGSNGSCVSAPKTFTINVNTTPTVIATATNVTCFGLCNGTTTLSAIGGIAPYSYSLAIGSTPICQTTSCAGLCAGVYTVTAKDANNCLSISNLLINEPSQLIATISNTNASCSSCTDGAASSIVSGGTPIYTYLWQPIIGNTPSMSNLPVGCYTCTVTDANGCSVIATTCISFGTGIAQMQNESSNLNVYPNPSNGVFTISNTINTDKLEVIIINTLGQTVMIKTIKNSNQTTIDMSKMSKGVYYLQAKISDSTRVFKLILE